MNLKQYPKLNGLSKEGFTVDEIERGIHTLWMDVICPHCMKEQTVAQTGFIGGPCCRCGGRTDGSQIQLAHDALKAEHSDLMRYLRR